MAGLFGADDEDDLISDEVMLESLDRKVGGRMQLMNVEDNPSRPYSPYVPRSRALPRCGLCEGNWMTPHGHRAFNCAQSKYYSLRSIQGNHSSVPKSHGASRRYCGT